MTGRKVPEWIGETANTKIPRRVRTRTFERFGGICHRCERKIHTGEDWILEHMQALVNGGENRESNFNVTCPWCVKGKNGEDMAIKKKNASVRAKHLLPKEKSKNPLPGSKGSKWKAKIGGGWVPRDE